MSQRALALALLAALLAACAGPRSVQTPPSADRPGTDGPPDEPVDVSDVPEPEPRPEPLSRLGNPDTYEVMGRRYRVLFTADEFEQEGPASWYGRKFHGRSTSSGEPYDMYKMTAAHKRLPLPSYVHVTNLANGRDVVVRVNDRGPFHGDRIIDLSYAAAMRLDMIGEGTAPVRIRALTLAGNRVDDPANPSLYLQTGAFSDPTNARDLASRLETMGLNRVFVTPTDDAQPLYRVRVGPFSDVDELASTRERLAEAGVAARTLRD